MVQCKQMSLLFGEATPKVMDVHLLGYNTMYDINIEYIHIVSRP